MKINVLDGSNQIGGNKINVTYVDSSFKDISSFKTSLMFDFGADLGKQSELYPPFSEPKKHTGLNVFFKYDLLPRLEGVYRRDLEKHSRLTSKPTSIDALFLSHAHLDHAKYLHFLRKEIPVYSSLETKLILKSIQDTGVGGYDQFIKFHPQFQLRPAKKGKKLVRVTSRDQEYTVERPYHTLQPEESVEINNLEIQMVPVNHSVPGACGYIIYSDKGNLVYTGDLRPGDLTSRFVELAAAAKPKWLLCEGTRVNTEKRETEEEVGEEINRWINDCEGLAIIDYPHRNIPFVKKIWEAAKEHDRDLVITLKQAYLLDLFEKNGIKTLTTKSPNIKIFIPNQGWGCATRDFPEGQLKQDYLSWQKSYLEDEDEDKRLLFINQLEEQQIGLVFPSIGLWGLDDIDEITLKAGSSWKQATCDPFSDQGEINRKILNRRLKVSGIKKAHKSHASGHASGPELEEIIRTINPEILIPIHTEHPEILRSFMK